VPELSRAQLLVYAAIAIAVLLVGARWLRSNGGEAAEPAGIEAAPGVGAGSFELKQGAGGLVVHVAGAVRNPGVYRLPEGSRVTDALERAGGATAEALADGVNLAAVVADGQQIVIPRRAPGPAAGAGGVAPAAGAGGSGPISLGMATVEQLDTIEGIGPVTAQDIVEFRDEQGGLSSVEDLDQISGIGPATMEALRDSLQP
jgi:competence protein ComEA